MAKNYYSFDQIDYGESYQGRNQKTIWEVGFKDEKELLTWLTTELDDLTNVFDNFNTDVKKHIAIYRGIQYYSQEARTSRRDREESTSKFKQKVVINHIYDITEQKVSRSVKFKPNVAYIPVNDEVEDRHAARVAKMTADFTAYNQRLDHKLEKAVRNAIVTGEGWVFIDWDPDLGPELKESKEARERNEDIPLYDEEGKPIKDQFGKQRTVKPSEDPINIGDVCVELVSAHHVIPERKREFEKCNFLFREQIVDVAVLKNRYRNKADRIKPDHEDEFYDFTNFEETKLIRETFVYHFYHKKTREVPKGRYIKFTRDVILENRDLPYSHGEFPCERLVEIEIPNDVRGRGSFINLRHLQAHINNLTSMQIRNQYMASHPKWFVPHGAIKLESLANDLTIVQYRGPVPPQLQQANPTGQETPKLRETIIQEMGQISGVHGVSRGEPPAGIKAGVALQFLAEQEHERQNSFAMRYNEYIRRIYKKITQTQADYYSEDDERIVRIIGKENEYMSEYLDPKYLNKNFDVTIQNTSALPKSVAARTQQVIDLNDSFPGMFTQEQVIDMLDLGKSRRFFNEATAAVRAAEEVFEEMINGRPVPLPEEYDDLIQYWKVFSSKIQEYSFKKRPPQIKMAVLDHLRAIEMLMWDKMATNQAFAGQVGTLTNYPLIFKPEVTPNQAQMAKDIPEPEAPVAAGGAPPPEDLVAEQMQGLPQNPQMPDIQPGMGVVPAPPPIQ